MKGNEKATEDRTCSVGRRANMRTRAAKKAPTGRKAHTAGNPTMPAAAATPEHRVVRKVAVLRPIKLEALVAVRDLHERVAKSRSQEPAALERHDQSGVL